MARPKIQFTDEQRRFIESMATAQCPDDQIAAVLDVGESTLRRHFGTLLKRCRKAGIGQIRTWQFAAAKKGNPAMLIWLGKQLLGQREPRQDFQVTKVEPFVVEIEGESTKTILGVNTGDQIGTREVN
jgi:hypothetical protein